MKLLKRLAALAAAALFTGAAATTAYAREVPDLTREGSISVTMTCDGARIGEGTLSLYRVGDIMENDSDYSFVFTEEFAACGYSLDDLESDKLAQDLVRYAKNHGIEPDTRTIPHSGQLVYEGVEPGLYLVEQKEANVEFYPIDPFLISVPMYDGEEYIYNVEAAPKLEMQSAPKDDDTSRASPATPRRWRCWSACWLLPGPGWRCCWSRAAAAAVKAADACGCSGCTPPCPAQV